MKTKEKSTALTSVNSSGKGIHRRDFFRLLGGGILIFVHPWNSSELLGMPKESLLQPVPKDFNAFLHISESGKVTGYTGKIDMGQGNRAPIMQLLADELCVGIEQVELLMGDTDLCPWDNGTNGSTSVRVFGVAMRNAAAEARMVLIELAAEKLGTPANQLEAVMGTVRDKKDTAKSIRYGELTKGQKIERHIDDKPVLLTPANFKYIASSFPRVDLIAKVTGAAKFSGDFKLDGMVHARILRPPSHGAKLVSADTVAAESLPGVTVIRDGSLIAVLHENRDKADEALRKIKAEYSFNEADVNDKTIFDWMHKSPAVSRVVKAEGNLAQGAEESAQIFETEFHNSYVAHAPIEPHTALAVAEGDKMTVWASAQSPYPLQAEIARKLGYPIEKVRVIVPFVGGGFGGKNQNQQSVEAATLAKLSGKPVMLMWTREEEFFLDNFRPAGLVTIKSGIDESGKINLWEFSTYFNYPRGSEVIYDVPNTAITVYNVNTSNSPVQHFPVGAWRAPGCNTHTHARESQIEIMAAKAGIDPLEFRLKNLTDKRMIGVLKKAADLFGYNPGKLPSGRGIGIACGIDVGTYVAVFLQLKVDKETGEIMVERVVCAQDMGLCVNPLGTTLQMEGCIIMGLGYALSEEIAFEGGKISSLNFDTYKIPGFTSLPKIETFIFDKKDQPMAGAGEPPVICIGAAVANAVFDATGVRLYQLPITPERMLEGLKRL
jgi:isoquinoline 1-oxidoreductase